MRTNITGGSPYEPIIGFSRAVRVGNSVHIWPAPARWARTMRTLPDKPAASLPSPRRPGESRRTFKDVVRTRMYLTHAEDWEAVGRVHGEFFGDIRPAATMVVVAALLNPAWRIEIEMDAVIPAAAAATQTRFTVTTT